MYTKNEIISKIKNDINDVIILEETDSTNNYLKTNIDSLKPNTVIIAKKQSSGRGRRGRSFISPEGGLYLSILIDTDGNINASSYPTVIAAVAVIRSIEECFGIPCAVKWVNDIYIDNKKLSGILCETTAIENRIIIGIGINVITPPNGFSKEIADIATSLSDHVQINDLSKFIARLYDNIAMFAPAFDIKSVINEYRDKSCVINKEISVFKNGTILNAKALEITDSASLVIEYPDRTTETLFYGDISVKLNV
ncbi:MAG: biotin--[Clostridia bacterium]|nr:biotin--[acetyl-CoA-carboxylase] ligase [Clostridia bacterium]